MTFLIGIALFAGGYVASIYTWAAVRGWVNGKEAEVENLKAKIDALRAKF